MQTVKCGAALAAVLAVASAHLRAEAAETPQNLGFGLDKLVESRNILKHDITRAVHDGYATEQAAAYAGMAITDDSSDRILVDIIPTGALDFDALMATLQASLASFTVQSSDANYRNGTGVIEALISVDDAEALARTPGVKAAFLALKPYTRSRPVPMPSVVAGDHLRKIGTAFDQGVIQHRVDRINQLYNTAAPVNYDGTGMTIGILSDSYDTRSASPHASTAVTNFDLPGASGNPWNTQPVVVLQDYPGGTDEGRGMTEIVYKMAPKARLGFATANNGEVGFANNIRALAGLPGYTYDPSIQKGFKADVIADDVGYYDEPWYQDGIISAGIDDVAAAGVAYFSSAANDIGINGYESDLRIIPNGSGLTAATNSALIGTNINLANVPANLYAGGFHNFNPNPGQQDVAQLVNWTGTQVVTLQWDDPYDSRDLDVDQPPIYSTTGTISNAAPSATFDQNSTPPLPPFTGGQAYVITEVATSGTLDAIIDIYDSTGALILEQDTGTDETVNFFAPSTGNYKVVVNRYSTSAGNFTFTVNTAEGTAGVTTDLNLLVFNTAGAYQGTRSLTANNLATNRPIELGQFATVSGGQEQFVIARSNTPTLPQSKLPTRVRWMIPGNGAGGLGPAEYFKYNTVTTGGHAMAAGCNGTAAYGVFKPNIPESFTSPGPATIFFDSNSNRLPVPEYRQQPRVAAADAGNTSFFSGDTTSDLDTNPNFSGTSAAAPHAAAIAALVLQSRGGPGSVSPEEMTQILQDSAFPHDLDPNYSSGKAYTTDGGIVTVTISSDNDANNLTGLNDTSSFQVLYAGAGTLASITFNPGGTAATGGNVTGGNNGPMNDTGSTPATISYFENNYPGMAFLPTTKAFTLGPLTGLVAADVTAPASTSPYTGFSNLTPAPGNGTNQFNTMTVGFPNGNFGAGGALRFTVGRGVAHSSVTGNGTSIGAGSVAGQYSADLFGGGVMIPSGVVINDGMAFSGTTTSGGTFSGVIRNNMGRGYSVLDGYGFIDAAAATGTLRGVPSAMPGSAYRGDSVLLTVAATPGSTPASTQLAVTASLLDIGGSVAQQFYDDGSHGDAAAGDNVFSFATAIGATAPLGPHALPIVVSDNEGRFGSAQIDFTVLAPTAPTGVGSAAPASVSQTQTTRLAVTVVPGAGPLSTGISVTGNLSAIGGSATAAFHDDGQDGDAVAGDNVFSYNALVPASVSAGAKTLPTTIADAQSRTSTSVIALTVRAPTSLSGSGAATPSTILQGQATLLSVKTTPGANPASTGIAVTSDLGTIGGPSNAVFHDDGLGGDAAANDGIYSYLSTVPAGVAAGAKTLSAAISDAQSRTATASIALTVQAAPTAVSIMAAAAPNSALPGGSALFTAQVAGGANPSSTGLGVVGDLSGIGDAANATFHDDGMGGDVQAGDGIYSYSATVGSVAAGVKLVTLTASDAQGRTATASIAFGVQSAGVLSGAGLPITVNLGTATQAALAVAVVPASNPASSGLTVKADLSSVGGSATQVFYDDATHGDTISGDRVFTFALPLSGVAAGSYTLPATITDAQSRTAPASIALTVQPAATAIVVTAAATPNAALQGGAALFTAHVTGGANPASTGISVKADLSGIGGSATQTLYDNGSNGDVTAGDGTYSYATTVGTGTAPGVKLVTVTASDAQSRIATTAVAFAVQDAGVLSGAGLPTTVNLATATQAALAVAVVPASNPASSGLMVKADLSSVGGSATQVFYDDATHGDAISGDRVFTFALPLSGVAAGSYTLPATITDAQSRTAPASIALIVQPATTALAVVAAATPGSALPGGSALFTATVTGGTNPASSGIGVVADLSGIGGSAAQTLYDDGTHGDAASGDGVYSFEATVAANASVGAKLVTVKASDAQNRVATAAVAFGVQAAGVLSGTGLPAAADVGTASQVMLTVAVVPGTNPASTGTVVTVDLSAVGGSATQSFRDDGSDGDATAGDNVFTHALPLAGVAPGVYMLPATVTDQQGRSANTTIKLTLSDVIFEDGFDG